MDYAASTPVSDQVLTAMAPYLQDQFYNPSSLYSVARQSRSALESARAKVADILGAKPTEIIFTAGATESINLAIQGVARCHPGKHTVVSAIEHDAVLSTVKAIEVNGGTVTIVPVKPNGIVDVGAVLAAVNDQTVLVSVMLANNEIGTVQPVGKIAQGLSQLKAGRKLPLYLHTDATQAPNYLDLHINRLGVDLLSLGGSKIYGPKQTGVLYAKTGAQLEPLIYGGGQERGRRSGTENLAGYVGLATALEQTQQTREAETKRLTPLRDRLIAGVLSSIPDAKLNGDPKLRLPNNASFTTPGAEGQAMVLYLDNAGVMASTGSACSSGDLDPSHVLTALGHNQSDANSSLRLTLGLGTTSEQIDYVLEVLPGIVKRLHELQA